MKFYKRILLTLAGAGTMTACGNHGLYHNVSYGQPTVLTGVVAGKGITAHGRRPVGTLVIDNDNDGIIDYALNFDNSAKNRTLFQYTLIGDTIHYRLSNPTNFTNSIDGTNNSVEFINTVPTHYILQKFMGRCNKAR